LKGGAKREMQNTIKLYGQFEKNEDFNFKNSTFEIVKMRIHGLGKNPNKSNITKEAFNQAYEGIFGIPIVAKYTEDNDTYGNDGDLTSHNQIIKKDKDGNYILVYDTVPLGFISPTSTIELEEVEENNIKRVYIVVDQVVLWKRYDSTKKIIEWLDNDIIPKVSMEIGDVDGVIDDGYFQIDKYEYQSVCALGSNIEPCFPNCDIQTFVNNDNKNNIFNDLYKEMLKEYSKQNKDNIFNIIDESKKGGIENVKEKMELLKKNGIKAEDLNFSIDDITLDELAEKVKDFISKADGKSKKTSKEKIKDNAFSLTNEQFVQELSNQLSNEKIADDWGYEYSRYSYLDYKDTIVYAWDRSDNWLLYGLSFTINKDSVIIDFDSVKRYKFEPVPFEDGDINIFELYPQLAIDYSVQVKEKELQKKFEVDKNTAVQEVQTKLDTTDKDFQVVKDENAILSEFKSNIEKKKREILENEVYVKFEKLNGVESYENLKKESIKYSIEELEEKCVYIAFKNNVSLFEKVKDNNLTKISIDKKESSDDLPYGGLIDRYKNK